MSRIKHDIKLDECSSSWNAVAFARITALLPKSSSQFTVLNGNKDVEKTQYYAVI